MTLDLTRYQPPGVYVEEDSTPLASVASAAATVVAIIGPSVGHRTNTEQFDLADTPGTLLSQKGIDVTSIVVTDATTGAVIQATDYDVGVSSAGALGAQDYTVTITRSATSTTAVGTTVVVAYNYQPPDFFTARAFDNFEDVKDAFGEPLNADPTQPPILSALSLAAQIEFQNGAAEVVLVPVQFTTTGTASANSAANRAAISAAYSQIASDPNVNVVVPITTGILDADAGGVLTDARVAMEAAARDNFLRVALVGFDAGAGLQPDTLARATASKRVVLVEGTTNGVGYYNGLANATLSLGNSFLAAALGGVLAGTVVQQPLTRQQVRGFTGMLGQPLSNSTKNRYSAAGVLVVEQNRYQQMVVRHGVTTDVTNINTRELSVVRAKDALVTMVRDGMDQSGLIGSPMTDGTLLVVKTTMIGLLDTALRTGVVADYEEPKVRQTSLDPSVVEIKFSYLPSYPLNYIVISFSINVATGDTTLSNVA